jgi:hypothetical protein
MKREKKKHCRNNSKIKLINIVERAKIDSPNLVHGRPNLVHDRSHSYIALYMTLAERK